MEKADGGSSLQLLSGRREHTPAGSGPLLWDGGSRLQIPVHAPSLGGPETLVVRPARSSHLGQSPEDRERLGITDDLVRVSVGLESIDELLEDFAQALE